MDTQLTFFSSPTIPLAQLPPELHPKERLKHAGAATLSNAELLALILGAGNQCGNPVQLAERLLYHTHGLRGLAQCNLTEITQVPGIGEAKGIALQAALELSRRFLTAAPGQEIQIRNPTDIANHLMAEMSLLEQEQLRIILLNTKNFIITTVTVYSGSVNTAVIRIAEVFREAIRRQAATIAIVHNHPSGDPTPSPEDVRVTEMIIEAGKLLDIEVLDHIVVGANRFLSLKERGLAFR